MVPAEIEEGSSPPHSRKSRKRKEDTVRDELAKGASFAEAWKPHGVLCTQETCSGSAPPVQ